MTPSSPREEQVKRIKDIFVSLMWVATRQFSQWIQMYGLTHPQFIALTSLAAHSKPCTMRDLTEVTLQDPPTMTGIIDRLVKMNLVERTRSETDRRVVLVRPTQKGVDLIKRIQSDAAKEDLCVYEPFSDDSLDQIEESLRHMLRMQVGRYTSLTGDELDAELERLQKFRQDPIFYMKSNDEANS